MMSKEPSESETSTVQPDGQAAAAAAETAAPATDMSVIAALRQNLFQRSPLRRKQAAMLNAAADFPKSGTILLLLPDEGVAADVRRLAALADPPNAGAKTWRCAAFSEGQRELLEAAEIPGAATAPVLSLPKVPEAEGAVDCVVASDCLEYVENPSAFMKELHRVLKPKSRFVLHIRRRRSSLVDALRRVAGLVDASRPTVHAGFTPTELFDALKDGFDIEERLAYGRFFTELATVLAELFAGFLPQSGEPLARQPSSLRRARIVFGMFVPIFFIAHVLDTLLFFLPTHHLVIRAKRRMLWASRITPRMRDGRSLAEVVLTGKIGTAVGK